MRCEPFPNGGLFDALKKKARGDPRGSDGATPLPPRCRAEKKQKRDNAGIGERPAHALLAGPCGGGPGSVLLLGKPPLPAAASARAPSRASGEVGREKGFFFACPVKALPSHLLEFLPRPREVKVPPSTSSSIAGGDCPRRRRC